MSGPDVAALAADLARAVELTMNPAASQQDRLRAYQACESFKDTSPLCAEAGLYLAASIHNSPVARHFGLQLMEHTVKYRWTQISQQEKLFIKVYHFDSTYILQGDMFGCNCFFFCWILLDLLAAKV